MNNKIKHLLAVTCIALMVAGCDRVEQPGNGVVEVVSKFDFATTVKRLEKALRDNPNISLIAPFDPFDHAANAQSVDLGLSPTRLFVFGNPRLGTGLMTLNPTAALDLPQKMLVYERDGKVVVAYNAPHYLAQRHDITGEQDSLKKIVDALQTMARAATAAE